MIPTHGPPPGARRWRRRPGAYAILLGPRGRLLLTEQATEDGPELQLPGGGIDPGEAPLPALAREIAEETGHRAGALRWVGTYRRFTWMPEYDLWAEKLCQVFAGRAGPRIGPPTEAGHRAVWLPPAAAATRLASPGDAALLRRWARAARVDRTRGLW